MAAEAEEFEDFNWEEHVAKKGMWAGAVTKTTIKNLQGLFNGKLETIYNDHTPALLKSIDEAIVNITDHEHRCRNEKNNHVTAIAVSYDKSGKITLENDGPGIPITENKKLSAIEKHPVYIPEMAFTKLFSGSNMNKKAESVTGGINGVGAKIITVQSLETILETIDTRPGIGKRYLQTFKCPEGKKVQIMPPKIENITKGTASKTKLTFLPDYKRLNYILEQNKELKSQDFHDIEGWIRLRLVQVAAYVHSRVKITFNGEPITGSVEYLAQLMIKSNIKGEESESDIDNKKKDKKDKKTNGENKEENDFPFEQTKQGTAILHDIITSNEPLYKPNPWRIAIAVSNSITKFNHMSIVNGVVCQKGTHIDVIKKLINDAVGAKLKAICGDKDKKVGMKDTCKNINIVVSAPIPGADWGGQRKDELQMKASQLKSYGFGKQFLDKLTSVIADIVLKANPKKVKVEYEKYTAPTSKGKGNMLFAVEGDSANKMIRSGLKLKKDGIPSFEKCGIFSLQGVIMNAMKETTEYSTVNEIEKSPDSKKTKEQSDPDSESDDDDEQKVLIQSDRLKANKTLQALASVLKLDYSKKYNSLDGMTFQSLVGCVDQDLDGSGKIFPLLVVYIFMFWPELIKLGFVKRLVTPLVRVFKKNKLDEPFKEFYYESEFKKWITSEGVSEKADEDDQGMSESENKVETNTKTYKIVYYKGLARHVKNDIIRMFENFDNHLYTLTMKDAEKESFRIYFGNDTGPRKNALKTPVSFPTIEQLKIMETTRKLSCSMLLDVDTKAYKLDDIQRKIPSIIDGLNRARRKILAGGIQRFSQNNKPIKVFQFGAFVAYTQGYHQGDASLNRTVMTMAQNHTTSRQYPLLLGEGYMGSRIGTTNADGVDLASARYVDVCLNTKLVKSLFPPDDKWILPYNFTDGERVEPQWFAPILPYALMDLGQLPSEGWKYKAISIHIDDIIKIVRTMIDEYDPMISKYLEHIGKGSNDAQVIEHTKLLGELEKKYPLRLHVHGFRGKFQEIGDRMYCIGDYNHESGDDTIYIKEIPVDISISKFISNLKVEKRAKYIESIHDRSDDDIDIAVTFKKGAIDQIENDFGNEHFDAFEDFLKLTRTVTPNLNYVNYNGAVIELNRSYLGVIFNWFPIRKKLYAVRLNRNIIILRLKILELEYIQKYIQEYNQQGNEINTNKYEDEDVMSKVLTAKKYIKLDSSLIHSPGYTPVEQLEELATKGPGISHNYIFNLQERKKVLTAFKSNSKKIEEMHSELKELIKHMNDKPFAGAGLWKSEIDSLYEIIKTGLDTGWTYRVGGKVKKGDGDIVKLKKRKTRAKK